MNNTNYIMDTFNKIKLQEKVGWKLKKKENYIDIMETFQKGKDMEKENIIGKQGI